jgi:hypothetical protein
MRAMSETTNNTSNPTAADELHRGRRERDKAAVDAKVEELKGKLHRGQQTEAAGAR